MRLVIAVLLFFSPLFFSVAIAEEFGRLSVQEVSSRLKEKSFFVFDNNGHERFQKGHVPGAKWVNPYAMEAKDLPADKTATLVFYCANEH
jgi:hypothetical protein